ncbi:MAG: extracellular solute-binding protein [Chloroflexales bacterium]|nr:extracellular solute-binding protein [Chloroflexales bacterium]
MISNRIGRLSRRAMIRLVAAGAGGALLAACGGSDPPQGADLQDATPVPVAPPTDVPQSTATVALLAADATAAPVSTSIPTSSVDAANTITLWHYDEQLKLVAQTFEQANPGVKVDIKSYWPDSPYFPLLRNALKKGTGAPDLAVIGPGQLAELVAAGGLADLAAAPFDGSKFQQDMVESTWGQSLFDGKLFGMPWNVEPASFWYRADVLKTAGLESEPEQIEAQTWEELFALGQALKAKKEGITLLPDATDIFWTVVGQQGFGWFDGSRVLIRQKGVKAATIAAKARKLKLDANTDLNDFSVLLRQGLAVGWLASPGFQAFLAQYAPETVGAWRAVAVPEGPLLWAGSLLIMPEQGKKQELAWKFVQHMCATVAAQNLWFTTTRAFPAYKPAWDDPLYDEPVDFFGGQTVYRAWTKVVEQAPASIFSPHDQDADDAVTNELKQMLYNDADPEQAMASAEAEVLRKVPGATAG